MGTWHGGRADAAWKRTARAVIARDGGVCQLRLEGCTGRATSADHVVPLVLGGSRLDPANLRAACGHCNSKAGGQVGNARGRVGPPSRRWW